MGYKKELFVGEVSSEFICYLCTGVVTTPVFVGTGNAACVTCLAENAARGPLSLNQMAMIETPTMEYTIQLFNLQMRCANFRFGCQEILPMKNFNEHVRSCGLSDINHIVSMVQGMGLGAAGGKTKTSPYSDISDQAAEAEAVLEARIAQPHIMFTKITGAVYDSVLQAASDGLFDSFKVSEIGTKIALRLNIGPSANPGYPWKAYVKIQEDGDHLHVNSVLAHIRYEQLHVLVWKSDPKWENVDIDVSGIKNLALDEEPQGAYGTSPTPNPLEHGSWWKVGHM